MLELIPFKNKVRSRTGSCFPCTTSLVLHFDCIFACEAERSKCNQEYVKDSSLDTVGESSADPVPLRELVEGLDYSRCKLVNCGSSFLVGL